MTTSTLTTTRLQGRPLLIARLLWAALVVLALVVFAAAVPARYQHINAPPEVMRANLAQLGIPLELYAAYMMLLVFTFPIIGFTVAAVILSRKSDDWLALLAALYLVLAGAASTPNVEVLIRLQPAWFLPARFALLLAMTILPLLFFLFPNGRFVPGWARLPVLIWTALHAYMHFDLRLYPISEAASDPVFFTGLAGLLGGIAAQIYRYRRVSSPIERQQTKWVLVGFIAAPVGYVTLILLTLLFPALVPPEVLATPYDAFAVTWLTLCFSAIPITIGIAILRAHLWEIDLIINRALVYGTLSGLLLAVYLGGIVLLQSLFRTVIGQESNLAVVVATLAAGALFQPLRARLQAGIDRHFYRRKYDAARTLAAFNARLRDEVDLARLSDELVGVVAETMQPTHVSLWLRSTAGHRPAPDAPLTGPAADARRGR